MKFTSFYKAAAPAILPYGKLPTFVQTGKTGRAAPLFGAQHQSLVQWGLITRGFTSWAQLRLTAQEEYSYARVCESCSENSALNLKGDKENVDPNE